MRCEVGVQCPGEDGGHEEALRALSKTFTNQQPDVSHILDLQEKQASEESSVINWED